MRSATFLGGRRPAAEPSGGRRRPRAPAPCARGSRIRPTPRGVSHADHQEQPRDRSRAGATGSPAPSISTPSRALGGSRLSAASVHFTPGARTAWHTHPNGQTIWVLEGVGLAQRRGGPVEVIRPGDRVFFEPGEEHWHGAAPDRFLTHLSMIQVDDDGNTATWGDHVTDEEYEAAPSIEGPQQL